jgi:hypothetical protein
MLMEKTWQKGERFVENLVRCSSNKTRVGWLLNFDLVINLVINNQLVNS